MTRKEKYSCPCCGYKTLHQVPPRSWAICPICYWEDDPVQFDDPDYAGGANKVSLKQAQKNFAEFGTSEMEWRRYVRQPRDKDERDSNWKAF
ncbi:MAG: CPCC family cysteine-rich protein [Pyrinomonadaceae bacterium]